VVTMSSGLRGMLDLEFGEVMHPVVGALVESERYVASCGLAQRLSESTTQPLTVFDVGLGAASNASAVWRMALSQPSTRALHLVSFERELAALHLASQAEHAEHFGITGQVARAVQDLLHRNEHRSGVHQWKLIRGELPQSLAYAAPALADIVLWDPFSPKGNPELWNVTAFEVLRARCGPRATLFTFSGATAVRSALLLAGFYVGFGESTKEKGQYTCAACDVRDLARPLDRRWLERLLRSSCPLPGDAPEKGLEQIQDHPQFRNQ
jgi:queuine tRNA-ribosyltransferase